MTSRSPPFPTPGPGDGVGRAVIRSPGERGEPPAWLSFRDPVRVVSAVRLEEVVPALESIERAVEEEGRFAAGFLAYEASPAFDPSFRVRAEPPLPLLWFGIYPGVERFPQCPPGHPESPSGTLLPAQAWEPTIGLSRYRSSFRRVKELIARGETYQVNLTHRLQARFGGDPWSFFRALCRAQPFGYSAYLDAGRHVVCSVSPELFFRREGDAVICRPMKGTAPRGRTPEEDRELLAGLQGSAKDRAENLMVVDMVRNDLGRVAAPGSVRVSLPFAVERHPTLFQMTSTVTAITVAPLREVLAALFPCASVTGPPKVRTMEIISRLEDTPRGVYTGCIGHLAPGRKACFSVAIRTVHLDREAGVARYGTGGGVVWESVARREYQECRTKTLVLSDQGPPFRLVETILWRPRSGYFLLGPHLARLAWSAEVFGYPVEVEGLARLLEEEAGRLLPEPHLVRLLVEEGGSGRVEAVPLARVGRPRRWTVALSPVPVDPEDRFLYHKTTRRAGYEAARRGFPGHDDVLFQNRKGELTEATVANLVVRTRGELVTPPVSSGLLPGVYRAHLLSRGRLREAVVTPGDLRRAEAVFLINSVRGWIPAVVDFPEKGPGLLSPGNAL